MPTIDAELLRLGLKLSADIVESQRRKGLRASGESAASVHPVISRSGNVRRITIYGLARFRFQQDGRGPGKGKKPSRKLVAAIENWLKIKGLDLPAYAVAFKINRDGIKVPNPHNEGGVLSEPMEPGRVMALAKEYLRPAIKVEIKGILQG